MTTPGDLFRAGDLEGATAAAKDVVRSSPRDSSTRMLLAELSCFAGNFEAADRQLDVLVDQEPDALLSVAYLRHLVRSEVTRREVFDDGRAPELLTGPDDSVRHTLRALLAMRDGDRDKAAAMLVGAEEQREPFRVEHGGNAGVDVRDMDDVVASVLEVTTADGRYCWVPMSQVVALAPQPIKRPRELIWRPARLTLDSGEGGDVALHCLYAGTAAEGSAEERLGRATNWLDDGGAVRGRGLRCYLVGDDVVSAHELETLTFERTAG